FDRRALRRFIGRRVGFDGADDEFTTCFATVLEGGAQHVSARRKGSQREPGPAGEYTVDFARGRVVLHLLEELLLPLLVGDDNDDGRSVGHVHGDRQVFGCVRPSRRREHVLPQVLSFGRHYTSFSIANAAFLPPSLAPSTHFREQPDTARSPAHPRFTS